MLGGVNRSKLLMPVLLTRRSLEVAGWDSTHYQRQVGLEIWIKPETRDTKLLDESIGQYKGIGWRACWEGILNLG
jgi:hypothetical protein